MIGYVTVGADDIARAKRFYSAFLPALDYELDEGPEGLSYTLPAKPGLLAVFPDFYVKPTFDGRPASAGNGAMIAFDVRSQKQVRDLHNAALAAGGTDEGPPGFRAAYGPTSTLATFVTLKATRSPCIQTIRTNLDGTASLSRARARYPFGHAEPAGAEAAPGRLFPGLP